MKTDTIPANTTLNINWTKQNREASYSARKLLQ